MYPVIVAPPSEAGAVQETVADRSLPTAAPMVGAPGDERGGVVFSSTESVPWKSLAARRSGHGVAVQVADRDHRGPTPVARSVLAPRVPVPLPSSTDTASAGTALPVARSAEAVAVEVGHRDRGRGVAGREVRVRGNVPSPRPNSTEMPSPKFAVTRSSAPSPFRSATATA